jgi:hypothetical protein
MRAALLVAMLVAAGCRYGAPYVVVTVSGNVSVKQLRVTVRLTPPSGAPQSDGFDLPATATTSFALPKSFSLQLPSHATGTLLVSVAALDGSRVIASGSNHTLIEGDGVTALTVMLSDMSTTDMSTMDMSTADMGTADMSKTDISMPDMARPDLAPATPVWTEQTPLGIAPLLAVWGSGPGDVYAVGQMQTIIQTSTAGVTWNDVSPASGGTGTYDNIWGSSATRIFVVGFTATPTPVILAKTTGGWVPGTLPSPLAATQIIGVWGTDTEAWAVGNMGVILHTSDNQHWSPQNSTVATVLYSIWGSASPLDIYVAGLGGTLLRSTDGKTWKALAVGSADLKNVFGVPQKEVIAVGPNSTVLRSVDGMSFPAVTLSASSPLSGDWALGSDWFLVSGADNFSGASIWWSQDDGMTFNLEHIPDSKPGLFGLWGSAVDDVYAVGALHVGAGSDIGVIFHRQRP